MIYRDLKTSRRVRLHRDGRGSELQYAHAPMALKLSANTTGKPAKSDAHSAMVKPQNEKPIAAWFQAWSLSERAGGLETASTELMNAHTATASRPTVRARIGL